MFDQILSTIEFNHLLLLLIFIVISFIAINIMKIISLLRLLKRKELQQNFQTKNSIIDSPITIKSVVEREWDTQSLLLGKSISRKYLWLAGLLFINFVLILIFIPIFLNAFFSYPKIIHKYPEWNSYWNDYDQPIHVVFDRPIDTKSLILNMSPETGGRWEFEKEKYLPFVRSVKFYPEETVYPGNKVIVYFTHVTNYFNTIDNREELLQFYSVDLPTVASSNPEKDSVDIKTDTDIVFNLSHKEGEFVDWAFRTNQEDAYEIERNSNDVIKLKFNESMKQNTEYIIKVFQIPLSKDTGTGEVTKKGETVDAYTLKFQTVAEPLILSTSPQGAGVMIDSPVKIVFEQDMDKASVEGKFNISPNISGSKYWEKDNIFIFKPDQLQKETRYNVSLAKGMQTKVGGVSNADSSYNFETIGAVKVASWSPDPRSNSTDVDSKIRVLFNQAVDSSSAQEKFHIDPFVDGKFSWSGNTMTYNPTDKLTHSTEYSIRIDSGVKTIHGLDSRDDVGIAFTTQAKKIELNVPQYSQVNSKECQIIATQMILAYKGKSKDKMSIYNGMAKDNTVCDPENNTWGNPHAGFVGNIDGNHDCASGSRGYGVYWGPVSNYLSGQGVSNSIRSGMSISSLTHELESGHPVMLWWQNGWSTPDDISWSTPDGQYIRAVNGMHSEIAVGFVGPNDNPTHIIVRDPWRGRRVLEIGNFKGLWSYFGNTGIVVY